MGLRCYLEKYPYAILSILFFAVSISSLESDFLFIDDLTLIVNNPQLDVNLANIWRAFVTPLGQITDAADYTFKFLYYRPALNLLYMLNSAVWGINPVGFHIANLLFHLATTLLVYQVGLLLFSGDRAGSLVAAAIFCIHPVHNELIGRVAMNENLLGLFIALSIFFYLSERRHMSLLLFICALFTKESAVMLPVVFILFELRHRSFMGSTKALIPFFTVTLGYLLVRWMVIGAPGNIAVAGNLFEPFLIVCSALATYFRLLFMPYHLSVFYPSWKLIPLFQGDLLISCSICVLLVCAIWKILDDKLLLPLLCSVLVLLLPVSLKANALILGLDRAFIAERQLYVPAIFFSLFVAAIIHKFRDRAIGNHVLAGIILVTPFMAGITIAKSAVWKNSDLLQEQFIREYPASATARLAKGIVIMKSGGYDQALETFKSILPLQNSAGCSTTANSTGADSVKECSDLAAVLNRFSLQAYQSEYAETHLYMGKSHLLKKDMDAAMKKFKVVISLDPHSIEARTALADIYLKRKMFSEASREYKAALTDIEMFRHR